MAYTEFYCQNGGSNLNAGSTTNNTAAYTSTNGNWNGTTTFTPADTQSASLVSVGDWASVYIDGASVGVYIARVTTVNQSGGNITSVVLSSTAKCGAAPASNATARTMKVGGAWLGPNAASGFPFILASYGNIQDASSHLVRTNLKNDQTYTLTAAVSFVTSGTRHVIQGYSSSVNDGGKATWDGTTNAGSIISDTGASGNVFIDHIFKTSISSGSTDVVTAPRIGAFIRCVFTGSRNNGITAGGASIPVSLIECEAYGNNTANASGKCGISLNDSNALRCISHDNTGSNTAGFIISGGTSTLQNCISDTNGGVGVSITSTSSSGPISVCNCDVYNSGSDGIKNDTAAVNIVWIENCNLVKNTGAGINNVSTSCAGFVYNCGYGSGTQANGSADTINNFYQTGTVTYGSNLTPWVDPANGDFRINLAAANFAGRAAFTETASSYAGTVGYPDIGAAQSLTGGGGTFSKEVSYGSAS